MSSLDDFEISNTIIIIGKNGKEFIVDQKVCEQSGMLHTVLENDKTTKKIELNVEDSLLEKAIEYMNYHSKLSPSEELKFPEKLIFKDFSLYVKNKQLLQWDHDFIMGVSLKDEAVLLMTAANYLDIKGLYNLCGARIAHRFFSATNHNFDDVDFTPIAQELGIEWDEEEDKKIAKKIQEEEDAEIQKMIEEEKNLPLESLRLRPREETKQENKEQNN
jgi:hypothetical protein